MTEKRARQYRQLGFTIAYYRKLKGMTQLQLAEAVNVSRTHISTLEAPNMPTRISLDKLMDIADTLEIPVKCFFEFYDSSVKRSSPTCACTFVGYDTPKYEHKSGS